MSATTFETVLDQARRLTPEEQMRLIEALEDAYEITRDTSTNDAEWDRVFAMSHDKHRNLAAKLRADMKAGRTQPLDPEQL